MRFKPLKKTKAKEEPEEEIIEVDKRQAGQIAEIQQNIDGKTKNLEKTTQQLQELSDKIIDIDESEKPKPHGPISELTVELEDKMMDIDLELDNPGTNPDEEDDGIQLVELGNEPTIQAGTAEAGKLDSEQTEETKDEKAEPEDEKSDEDDSFSNLFSDEEDEGNPLDTLINSLPDVTAQELVDDLQEIKDIILDGKSND